MRSWNDEQQAIFAWFERGEGNLVVRARAGTGKTTTILEGVRRVSGPTLLAAFNKTIAEELNQRLSVAEAHHAEAKTLHALGFALLRRRRRGIRVDEQRSWDLAHYGVAQVSVDGEEIPREVGTLVRRLHTRIRETLPHLVVGDRDAAIATAVELAAEADCYPDDKTSEAGWDVVRIARASLHAAWAARKPTMTIDYADMIYLPIAWKLAQRAYDLVVVDEAQDMTAAQLELALGCVREGGRVAVVGDDRQAIYAFRGADSTSIDRLKNELSATELGLRTTYRCGTAIVAAAQRYVPDIQAAGSHVGAVSPLPEASLVDTVVEGDFVLSRKNAPLVQYALALFRAGRRAHIRGRDLGRTLAAVVRARKATDLDDLRLKLAAWLDRETREADRIGEAADARLELVVDQHDFVVEVMRDESIASVAELCARIEGLFADDGDGTSVMLSTVHKAKGLEADRVFVLEDTFTRTGLEEENLRYVAITRARLDLRLVSEKVQPVPVAP